jgi:hypothetical protein
MSKGRYVKKKKTYMPFWLILTIAVVLIGAVLLLISGSRRDEIPSETEGQSAIQTEAAGENNAEAGTDVIGNTEDISSETAPAGSAPADPEETLNPGETKAPQENVVPQPTVVIVQQADAEYEKWLAATMVMCVSMEYPDFELEAIYAASATALDNKFDSQGAYIVFTAGGNRICIHSKALEAERTAPGTKDISSETIGYATFDQLDPNSVDFSSFEKIDLEDLTELFAQSLLVSIYAR